MGNSIARLNKLEKESKRQNERLTIAFVSRAELGVFTAACHLWDGVPKSSGRRTLSKHGSEDEALEAVAAVAKSYPNHIEGHVVFIDDFDLED